jgi:hypothetical protein
LRWVIPLLGALIALLTLVPADLWQHPANDAVYAGFDRTLTYLSPRPAARISGDTLTLSSLLSPESSANLLTTPLSKFDISVDIRISDDGFKGEPLRIGAWSPWTGSGYFLTFGPAPGNRIDTDYFIRGQAGKTLIRGQSVRFRNLGTYTPGDLYHLELEVDRVSGVIMGRISGAGLLAVDLLPAVNARDLFKSTRLSLTASRSGTGGGTSELQGYKVTLPHQRFFADKIDDPRAGAITLILLAFAGLITLGTAASWLRPRADFALRALKAAPSRAHAALVHRRGSLLAGAAVAAFYVIPNALLFGLGGHPFDIANEKLYAYTGAHYGLAHLYYLPDLAGIPFVWNGVPYGEAAFPYGPVFAYVFSGIGSISSLFFGSAVSLTSIDVDYVIKAVNVAFGLGDALLIYAILKQLKITEKWSRIGAGLFLFNPAVWFSMSVWGTTHVISLFFVLLAVWLAERSAPVWAWMALAAACLTRPQMLAFGFLLGIVFLRKFSWRQNLFAGSWTAILTFLLLAPFTLTTSPSLPVDVLVNDLRIQEAGGNDVLLTTVSQDAYSVWPLVTYLAHGASGLERSFTPSSAPLAGPLTYQRLSQFLTIAAMVLVGGLLITRKRRSADDGAYLPLVALGIVTFLMLTTGLVATHFLLALPFLILCRRWLGDTVYFFIVLVWTVTTFVPMFGDMGLAISRLDSYPLLAPAHNAITSFFVKLYAWDRFITVSIVANICALVWLAILALRSSLSDAPIPSAARRGIPTESRHNG